MARFDAGQVDRAGGIDRGGTARRETVAIRAQQERVGREAAPLRLNRDFADWIRQIQRRDSRGPTLREDATGELELRLALTGVEYVSGIRVELRRGGSGLRQCVATRGENSGCDCRDEACKRGDPHRRAAAEIGTTGSMRGYARVRSRGVRLCNLRCGWRVIVAVQNHAIGASGKANRHDVSHGFVKRMDASVAIACLRVRPWRGRIQV